MATVRPVLREYTGPGYRPSGFDHVKQLSWYSVRHVYIYIMVRGECTMRPEVVKLLYNLISLIVIIQILSL